MKRAAKKANYGARGDEIKMRWSQGRFVLEDKPVRFGFRRSGEAPATVDHEFMKRMRAYIATGRDLSPSPNAKNYAPEVLADGPRPGRGRLPSKARNASVQPYEMAMERAFENGTLRVDIKGPKSRLLKTIAICQQCTNEAQDTHF